MENTVLWHYRIARGEEFDRAELFGEGLFFLRRAAEEGILDVAYTTVDAPFGRMLVAATPQGLVRTAFDKERTDDVLTEQIINRSHHTW